MSLLPSFLAPRRRYSLGVLEGTVEAHVLSGHALVGVLHDASELGGGVEVSVLDRFVRWLASRAEALEAVLMARLAEVAPSHDHHLDSRLKEVVGSPLRGAALRRLRGVLLMAEHLRHLLPRSYPPTLTGGLLAVLMCLMPPGLL